MGTHRSTGSANFSHSRCRNRAVLKAPADYLGFRGAIHLWSGNPAEHQNPSHASAQRQGRSYPPMPISCWASTLAPSPN